MAAGLGLLRLPPADFWSMTPTRAGSRPARLLGPSADAPLPRTTLAHLMSRYPD